jgi:hypothetical protein
MSIQRVKAKSVPKAKQGLRAKKQLKTAINRLCGQLLPPHQGPSQKRQNTSSNGIPNRFTEVTKFFLKRKSTGLKQPSWYLLGIEPIQKRNRHVVDQLDFTHPDPESDHQPDPRSVHCRRQVAIDCPNCSSEQRANWGH